MEHNKTEFEIFTHNVAWLRKHYSISKKQMAEILGIGIGSLNKIEQGQIPPRLRVDIIFAVYKHFGIHPSAQFSQWLQD